MNTDLFRYFPPGEKKWVRVSGPQIGANKGDHRDRPCMYVFVAGAEFLCHEIVFEGLTRMVQDFEKGCSTTGAVLWLETEDGLYAYFRNDRDNVAHQRAVRVGAIDDAERG